MVALNPAVREVTVLCHSMGCLLTLNALQSKASRSGKIGGKIKNVALVAPDVGFEVFREQIQGMGSSRPRVALFVSQDDRALKLSKSISGGVTRLGDVNPEEEPYKRTGSGQDLVVDITHLQGRAPFESVWRRKTRTGAGSPRVSSRGHVAATGCEALHHGSSTLELGGCDAAIVSTMSKEIAPELFAGATFNSGQPWSIAASQIGTSG
jgi:hypothetical protein